MTVAKIQARKKSNLMNSAKRITETVGESGWKTALEEKTEKEMESTESQLLHAQRWDVLSGIRTLCGKIYIVNEEKNERKLIYEKGIFKVQK